MPKLWFFAIKRWNSHSKVLNRDENIFQYVDNHAIDRGFTSVIFSNKASVFLCFYTWNLLAVKGIISFDVV